MVQNCLRDMFIWWLDNGKEVTVKLLAKAVHEVGEHAIERGINEYFGIPLRCNLLLRDQKPSRKVEIDLPQNVERYCSDIRARYERQSILPESSWPPSVGRKYVELALINQERCNPTYESVIKQQMDYTRGNYDKILKYKTKIDLKEAFGPVFCEGGSEIWPLRMLVDGTSGVGKTTLSRKISRKWAKGKILQKYWLVLLLHLRETAISKAKTIDDFFYHDDPDIQCDVVKFVRNISGDGLLIIFDGFDELSVYERSEESLFLDVCKGNILPRCAVVITSRPYASRTIQELPSINRHVEVLGFTNKQVEDCIRQKIEDQDKAKELCTELKDRLDVASVCQIPLNCSIVLFVYEQQNCCLPHTLTELYDLFVLHSLKRFIKQTQNSVAANRLLQLQKLQEPTRGPFRSLCNLAFKGLEDDKLVFSQDDVEEYFPISSNTECNKSTVDLPLLNLMTSAKSYSSRGAQDTYSFLHLTIQEFLAAYWIAHYSLNGKCLDFFQKYLNNNRFRMVLLFLSGMTKLAFSDALSMFDQNSWNKDKIHICHLLYESRNFSLCKAVSEACTVSDIELVGSRFEALVVSYFVAHSECQWENVRLTPDNVQTMLKVFSTNVTQNSKSCLLIKKVIIPMSLEESTYNECTSLLQSLEKFTRVDSFSINVTIIIDNSKKVLDPFIMNLEEVLLAPKSIQDKVWYVIELAVLRASKHRNVLVRQFCEILAKFLAQNKSITDVILNCVSANDVELIFTRLMNCATNLAYLVCSGGESGSSRRCPNLTSQPPIWKSFCSTFAKFISQNKSLKEITLDVPLYAVLGWHDLQTLKSGCEHNNTLQKLSICYNQIIFKRNQETDEMELIKIPDHLSDTSPNLHESADGRNQDIDSLVADSNVMKHSSPPKHPLLLKSSDEVTNQQKEACILHSADTEQSKQKRKSHYPVVFQAHSTIPFVHPIQGLHDNMQQLVTSPPVAKRPCNEFNCTESPNSSFVHQISDQSSLPVFEDMFSFGDSSGDQTAQIPISFDSSVPTEITPAVPPAGDLLGDFSISKADEGGTSEPAVVEDRVYID